MADLNTFSPIIAAREGRIAFIEESKLAAICTTEYEQDLTYGKAVELTIIDVPVSVATPAAGAGDGTAWEEATAEKSTLTVDNDLTVPVVLSKTNIAQNRANLEMLVGSAIGMRCAYDVDAAIAALHGDVAAGRTIGSSTGFKLRFPTTNAAHRTVASVVSEIKRRFMRAQVPVTSQATFAISPEVGEILEEEMAGRDTSYGDTVTVEGAVAKIRGFNIVVSSHIETSGSGDAAVWNCLATAGMMGIGLAHQIDKEIDEALLQDDYLQTKAFAGRQLFGVNIMRPKAVLKVIMNTTDSTP